jgi:hypothetical protein
MLDKDRRQWPQDIDFGGRSVSATGQATRVGLARNPLGMSGATQPGCREWMRIEAACRVQHAFGFELVHIPLTMQSHPILSSKLKWLGTNAAGNGHQQKWAQSLPQS